MIGSGATAVTLVPELAKTAAHVTMLQRSPTYVVALPAEDRLANWLRRVLPARLAYAHHALEERAARHVLLQPVPAQPGAREELHRRGRDEPSSGRDYDVDTHFTPRYNPWDQRLCLVPDGDLFDAIRDRARVGRHRPDRDASPRRASGSRSGAELEADLIVTATGLNLQVLGGVELSVDGERVELARTLNYKGMMFSDVPNLALGVRLHQRVVDAEVRPDLRVRLPAAQPHGASTAMRQCTPRNDDPTVTEAPWIDFSSGYVQRALAQVPEAGLRRAVEAVPELRARPPDAALRQLDDGVMVFSNPTSQPMTETL